MSFPKRKAQTRPPVTLSELEYALTNGGLENARHEALLIAEELTGKSRASLMLSDHALPAEADAMLQRRLNGEPLQYILGKWDFYNIQLKVSPAVLIPRPETELLVEMAISLLPPNGNFADLCSGSGCIAAAIAANRPDANGTAAELSKDAFGIMCENFRALCLKDSLRPVLADVTRDIFSKDEAFNVIVTNPPYIALDEMPSLARELSYEPKMALTDFSNGTTIIKKIIDIYPQHLKSGGVLLIEIGASQGESILNYAKANGLFAKLIRDLSKLDRIVAVANSADDLARI